MVRAQDLLFLPVGYDMLSKYMLKMPHRHQCMLQTRPAPEVVLHLVTDIV
jgi:hypothetical protein